MSNDNNDIQEVTPKRKHHIAKNLAKFLLTTAIIVGVLQYVCYYHALPIAKERLCQAVKKQTHGLYTMDFADIKINFLGKSITLDSFSLTADTTKYLQLVQHENYNKAIYNISVEQLTIDNIGLKSFFSQNELYIKQVEMISPEVRLVGKPHKNTEADRSGKYDAIHKDLYPMISQYFDALNIRNIKIQNGYFDFRTKISQSSRKVEISKINITLKNFYLNKEKYILKKQFFYSDVIEISSNDYTINLADSIHSITAGHLSISTYDSTIHAVDVHLKSNNTKKNTLNVNKFDVDLSEIEITGLDISQAFFQKTVNLKTVEIKSPTIQFSKGARHTNNKSQSSSNTSDWYPLIRGTLNGIYIDSMRLSNASMIIRKPTIKRPLYDINKVNILLENFELDSTSHLNKNKILYSNNLDISIKKYQMLLPDNIHLLSADSIMISTNTGDVKAQKINIHPIKQLNDSTEKAINISVPSLEISDMDFIKAYNYRDYNINKLKIICPNIHTYSFIDSAKQSTTTHNPKLLEAMSNEYFKSLNVKAFVIYKGNIDITSKASIEEDSLTFSGKLTLTTGNLVLNNSTIRDEIVPFRAGSVRLNISDAIIKPSKSLHTLRCANLTIDTQTERILMTGFSYASQKDSSLIPSLKRLHKHSLLDITIDKAEFSKGGLLDAFYKGDVQVGKIKITNPKFYINLYPQLKRLEIEYRRMLAMADSTTSDTINIPKTIANNTSDSVSIDSTLLKYSLLGRLVARNIPHELQHIKLDTLISDSSILSFNIRDTSNKVITGTESNFKLGIKGFDFCRDSAPSTPKIMFADSYTLDLNNFRFLLPDKTHILKTGNITINTEEGTATTTAAIISPRNDSIARYKKQITAYCPELYLNGIDFYKFDSTGILPADSCRIHNTVIMICKPDSIIAKKQNTRSKRPSIFNGLTISNIQSFGDKFALTDQNDNKLLNMSIDFACDSLNVNNKKNNGLPLTFCNPYVDINDFFSNNNGINFSNSNIHLQDDTIRISQIDLKTPSDTTKPNIKIKEVMATSLDIAQLAFNKNIIAHTISATQPQIRLTQVTERKQSNRTHIQFNTGNWNIKIDTVTVRDASLHLFRRYKRNLFFGKMYADIVGLNTTIEHPTIYPADKFIVGIHNYNFNIKDSVYRFVVEDAEADIINSTAKFRNIDYQPRFSRYDYHKHFQYRHSASYMHCNSAFAYNFDFSTLILQKRIHAGKLVADRISFQNYENKTKPNDTSSIKPNLHQFIKERIPIRITVDTTLIKNSYVGIEQLDPDAATPGILTITSIDGKIVNFTNDPEFINRNNAILISCNGKLMNTAPISGKMKYVMNSATDEFICNFKADSIALPIINPYLENALFAKINDGILTSGQVNFKSDNIESRGEAKLMYHDLKFQVNKKDSVQQRRRGLLSLLANTVIRTKNTRKVGYIYTQPDNTKSFAGYWMKSILSGIKATVGFETKEQKDERRFSKKLVDVVMRRKLRQEYIIPD